MQMDRHLIDFLHDAGRARAPGTRREISSGKRGSLKAKREKRERERPKERAKDEVFRPRNGVVETRRRRHFAGEENATLIVLTAETAREVGRRRKREIKGVLEDGL